jgi:cytochrome oxidase Cu insertion factor (SCO1/SenC/PrrC family)
MSGMGGAGLTTNNSVIVSAFQSSLLHELLVVLAILAVLAVAWNLLRGVQLRRAVAQRKLDVLDTEQIATSPEPLARRVLRVGFGLIWLFDGILQAQPAMPVGLANQVSGPAAAGSPSWVVHLVNAGALIWNNHPITAAVASVWVQVGIGIWLLVAPRGRWSQLGGVVSVGWGLIVWCFGEAFGGIFAPGLSVLFGAPGAVIFYCLAGGLVALPERVWSRPGSGRRILAAMGLFFVGVAVLQAWPGRGFWQGQVHGHATGTLVSMVDSMAGTPQPGLLSSWVTAFGSFDAAHGFAVNLFVVIALATIGLAFCSGRPRLVRAGVYAGCLFCLADWVLVEDFGFFGGLGTDPNSMIPIALVLVAGYVALVRPSQALAAVEAPDERAVPFLARLKLDPSYTFRSLAAAGAALVVLLGAVPMALASTNPNADAIITEAMNGAPDVTNTPAPGFSLTDQNGRAVTLSSLRGKAVAVTFLDPVCTTQCPLIGQEFREADVALGVTAKHVEFIAIVANPLYRSSFDTNAFDRQEGLGHLSNWLYLTGSVAQLSKVWNDYGVQVGVSPAGAMASHAELAYVIDARGHTRYVMSADPGPGTSTTQSSFVGLLDQELDQVMAAS